MTSWTKFWQLDSYGVTIGKITNYARNRFGGFQGIYDQLSQYAHPRALSILASSKVVDSTAIRWQSAPQFKSDSDALIACAWIVELAHARAHLLVELAGEFGLLPAVVDEWIATGQPDTADS